MKIRVALIFGGRSVEHEVSVISAIQAYMNMDREKYDITPIYMTKDNVMYIGDKVGDIASYRDIPGLLSSSRIITMINENGRVYLTERQSGLFGKRLKKEIDVVFPVVHGTNVEDGALQGYLKTLGVPFVGCDVAASAVGMDKYVSKAVLRYRGIPVLDACIYTLSDYQDQDLLIGDIEEKIGYPVIVKPVNLGSSVGISLAGDRQELEEALDDAFRYASRVLAEHAITNLREINCAVLGDGEDAIASECEEPFHSSGILSYEDKYAGGGSAGAKGPKAGSAGGAKTAPAPLMGAKSGMAGADTTLPAAPGAGAKTASASGAKTAPAFGAKTASASGSKSGSSGMASLSRRVPADIPEDLRERIRDLAVRSFKALDCNGVARIDFMIDESTGELYFNEINTIPGSLAFYLWEATGMPYSQLLDRMIELALKRSRQQSELTFSFDTNILAGARL